MRGAALSGVPSASEAHRADSFGNEAPTAGPSSFAALPGEDRHEPVTGGARVCQVGVNPTRRAVVAVGVDAAEKPSDPWPEKARRTAPRKGRSHLTRRGLPRRKSGVGPDVGVLGGHSVAEAGTRHVAWGPRRTAGKHLGLALLGLGRESMSEAGPSTAKSGYQWRPMRSPFGRELGRRRWDLLVEGASGLRSRLLWLGSGEAGPGSRGRARDAGHGLRAATRGVCESGHRARARPTTPT
jgi:hypothetical protein